MKKAILGTLSVLGIFAWVNFWDVDVSNEVLYNGYVNSAKAAYYKGDKSEYKEDIDLEVNTNIRLEFLEVAERIHTFMATNKYNYEQDGTRFPKVYIAEDGTMTATERKTVDCSSFITMCLNQIGYKYNSQLTSYNFSLNPWSFEWIHEPNDWLPGDILVYWSDWHHVAIYAGDGKVYDCGNLDLIRSVAPYELMPWNGKSFEEKTHKLLSESDNPVYITQAKAAGAKYIISALRITEPMPGKESVKYK